MSISNIHHPLPCDHVTYYYSDLILMSRLKTCAQRKTYREYLKSKFVSGSLKFFFLQKQREDIFLMNFST